MFEEIVLAALRICSSTVPMRCPLASPLPGSNTAAALPLTSTKTEAEEPLAEDAELVQHTLLPRRGRRQPRSVRPAEAPWCPTGFRNNCDSSLFCLTKLNYHPGSKRCLGSDARPDIRPDAGGNGLLFYLWAASEYQVPNPIRTRRTRGKRRDGTQAEKPVRPARLDAPARPDRPSPALGAPPPAAPALLHRRPTRHHRPPPLPPPRQALALDPCDRRCPGQDERGRSAVSRNVRPAGRTPRLLRTVALCCRPSAESHQRKDPAIWAPHITKACRSPGALTGWDGPPPSSGRRI